MAESLPTTDENRKVAAKFSVLLAELYSEKSAAFDAAMSDLRNGIEAFKPYILDALQQVTDAQVKGGLLELIGNSRDSAYLPVLVKELEAESCEVRFWAYVALQQIGTHDARRILRDVDVQTWRRRSTND